MNTFHGFQELRDEQIPELKARARLFRHVKSGAELLSVENDDENKVFGVTFRTPPADSTGVAHILEHAVLCGSRKYPVKELFVELVKGSLKTFVNAFTYPDKTCYPVASRNRQDFYNLLDVYLDAVFYPRLTPLVFQQEGWHYELESLDGPITLKGVVYNEKKGSYSSPESVIAEYSQQSLFPGHVYGIDSGGHPCHIPELTFEELAAFHRTYYHPSNARIYFYGDDHSDERLRLVDAYLRDFDARQVVSGIPPAAGFDAPQRLSYPYAVSGDADTRRKGMLTLNWLLAESTDLETNLALHILAHILIGTPASPLRHALLEAGLGEDLAGVGLDGDLRELYFSTGLKGMDVADAGRVETLIMETLGRLAGEGIPAETVEASLNTLEFRLRENNTGGYPQGLALMLRALAAWLYGGDPIQAMAFEERLAAIKARLGAGETYFENLIRRFFLDNPHRTTLILEPEPGLREKEEAAERARLDRVQAGMSRDDLEQVLEDTRRLKQVQETPDPPEALAAIPTLQRSDLDPRHKPIPLARLERAEVPVLYHDLPTRGIAYLDLGFDLHALPRHYLPYVPLLGRALLETGTQREDFVSLARRIGRTTGGIWPATFTSMIHEMDRDTAWLFLRGKATIGQAAHLLDILRDVLLSPRLDDRERFRQMVLEEKADQEARLVPAGHSMVDTRLCAHFNAADWAGEQMRGVSYLFFLRRLAEAIEADWAGVLETLEAVRRRLVNRRAMLCNVTLDEADWRRFEPQLASLLAQLPAAPLETVAWTPDLSNGAEGMVLPAQVNYVGKGADVYALGYTFHGSVMAITKYLRTTWLWERVRMEGGAYGAHCLFDHRSGLLRFLSYRDPNLASTLDVYDGAAGFLSRLELSSEELTRAIIGAVSDLDAHQLPDAKGYTSMQRYLAGESDEFRQRLRDELLSTSPADFKAFADVLGGVAGGGRVVILGSRPALEAAAESYPGGMRVFQVM
jgi:hypothetical protein